MEMVHHYRRRRIKYESIDDSDDGLDLKLGIFNQYKAESTKEVKRKCQKFYTNQVESP